MCLSSTLRFQFLATPVPKYLLCTLEQTDDCSEDLKVSCCQGDHHFCLGQVYIAEVTRTTRKIGELCTVTRSLHQTLQPPRGATADFAEVLPHAEQQAGRLNSGRRGENWSSARSCSAHQGVNSFPKTWLIPGDETQLFLTTWGRNKPELCPHARLHFPTSSPRRAAWAANSCSLPSCNTTNLCWDTAS